MDNSKVIFETHIDRWGRLKEGKEKYECPKCNGDAHIANSIVLPNGVQHYEFTCTECGEEWPESY